MVTNNKVLTVSYGTFSCTLEGFEDSFDTMKAIAEYFRDLASDDRYFGAEPPTPDAEMLARIAEREIERRVSARMDHGAIVLRATDAADPAPQPDQETPSNDPAQETVQDVSTSVDEDEASDDAVSEDTADADATPHVEAETQVSVDALVQEELIEETAQEAMAEDPSEAEAQQLVEDDIEEVAQVSEDSIAVDEAQEEDEGDLVNPDEIASDDIENVLDTGAIADASKEELNVDDAAPEIDGDMSDASSDEDDDDMFDIGAIVAATSEDVHVDETAIDDDVEDAAEALEDVSFDAFAASDVLVLQDSIKAAMADEDITTAEFDDAPVEVAADIEVLPPVVDADAEDWDDDEDAVDTDYAENSIAAKLDRIRAVVARGSHEADEDGFSEDEHARDIAEPDNSIAAAFDNVGDDIQDVTANDIIDETPEQPTEADSKPTLRARVVRMKKADFEEAVASGLLEAEPVDDNETLEDEDGDDIFAEDVAPADINAAADTTLTPEDEADLMAELAQVEAELKGETSPQSAPVAEDPVETMAEDLDDLDDDFADDVEDDVEDASETPALEADPEDANTAGAAHGEPDLSRLMAKANSEMKEPEGSRRRRAIAHLRAAVAATRAEKAAGGLTGNKDTTAVYRDDLASVVRAVPGGKDASQSATSKPRGAAAPLKLVAEQRIDTSEKAPEAEAETPPATQDAPAAEEKKAPRRVPVRPRRVSTDRKDREEIARTVAPVGSVSAVQGGFADYAQTVGAATMPQILEAAAAYVTFVKGQERFSRPMLMRMARDINEAEFSREEGLRSFGQLLRDQKIRKIAGGRFTADESINFKPQDRAAS
ncbi:hypothetical protein shim_16860 [Shimia sp. SK013]|uniref:hypothetical protein n=1 Tax=Shimia sp. SK013 TaxID=1389006 RepID=UPI0006CD52A0|nr:hypothetical protein [Shimia sp. SK013]KPA22239.1 hypothetical protein shim_16860 [Shimia sp. SK013]